MRRTVLAVILVLLVATGLLASPAPSATAADTSVSAACASQTRGFHELTLTVGSKVRAYTVYAPTTWVATRKVPVVYMFHGANGEATGTIWGSKLKAQADKDGFLIVAPQAAGATATWDVSSGVDVDGSDAQFVSRLPGVVAADWCVDTARQYAVGYSAGSVLTHALACFGGFPFAGYGGAGAQSWASWCPSTAAFDFVYFHGTADPYVPFTGNASVPSVQWSATTMAAQSGCEAQPTSTRIGTDVVQYLWSSCRDGKRQLVDVLEGGGHVWPGADEIPALGKNTTTISAAQVISDFWGLSH